MNGKLHGWEAVVLLAFIDEGLLLRAMSDALRGTRSAKAGAGVGAGAGAGEEEDGAGIVMANGGNSHDRDGLDALLPQETRRRNTLGRPQLYSAAPARFGCGEAGEGGGQDSVS